MTLTTIKPAELHVYWPFLERGLNDIHKRTKPDWLPPDVFMALRADAATACLVLRDARLLGFIIWHRQERVFSHILDVFVWAAWSLPLREQLSTDNMPEAVARGYEYLLGIKQAIGASRIIMISPRKGFQRKYGFKPLFTTYEVG